MCTFNQCGERERENVGIPKRVGRTRNHQKRSKENLTKRARTHTHVQVHIYRLARKWEIRIRFFQFVTLRSRI